jgi:hypothetical protein
MAAHVVGDGAGPLPVVHVRRELGRHEPADGCPELRVLGGEDRMPGGCSVHADTVPQTGAKRDSNPDGAPFAA